jgi:NAD-dependent dihydropyrimidine dehydrogenase PreA subunit
MTYVITEPCIGTCDASCIKVCPVDCIHGPLNKLDSAAELSSITDKTGLQLYINPNECIDCGACEPVCPVKAIYPENKLPDEWKDYAKINADFFL